MKSAAATGCGDWRRVYSGITSDLDMPRLSEGFFDCVFYLYPSEHEAQEGIRSGGSGFTVAVPCEQIPGNHFLYLVTNRHVIASADVIRLNTADGGMHVQRIPRSNWVKSKTDDLAVVQVNIPIDYFKSRFLVSDLLLSEDQANKMRIGIGDNIFMVGRFINHEGIQQNAPLVRFGSIAQMISDPIEYELEGKPHFQTSILADIRSIGGYSGSPVFLNEPAFWSRGKDADGKDVERPNVHYLIGIDWGHIKMWSPVCGIDERPIGQTQVNINSGMAAIIPSWKLLELLMSDELKQDRKMKEDQGLASMKSGGAAPDAVISGPPSDENPKHREGFNSLLAAAARKPKQDERT